jgi:hypothetical protein
LGNLRAEHAKGYALHYELDIPPEDPSPAAAYRSILL